MTFTRHQGMQWVSKQQFECLRQALWTVQLGTVKDYNTSFWKEVAKNGFDSYLTGIDEYENHSARSVRFVHDMDPGRVLSHLHLIRSAIGPDRVGWGEPDLEDSEEDALDPEHMVSTFFSCCEVDFVRKIEPMLLEEHVPAGQRWDNVKS
eukprot:217666-Amphidinium_carterae.1